MEITKEKIQQLIELNKTGVNFKNTNYFSNSIKRLFVEAKALIDRWDLVTTDFIVHLAHKEIIKENLKDSYDIVTTDQRPPDIIIPDTIWGARIHYTYKIPKYYGLTLYLNENEKL